MSVALIIPALNEETAIARVVQQVPRELVDRVIVVDNGSTDRTAENARAAGAEVVMQPKRGYGNACWAGFQAAQNADILIFLDGDGSFDPQEIAQVLAPLQADAAELVLGSRELGGTRVEALLPHQRLGNRIVAWLVRLLYQINVTDVGPFRAVKRSILDDLQMVERTYGWTTEMVVKAARRGYRIMEVPISYGERMGGESKVSGTLRGTVLTAYRMFALVLKHTRS